MFRELLVARSTIISNSNMLFYLYSNCFDAYYICYDLPVQLSFMPIHFVDKSVVSALKCVSNNTRTWRINHY